MNTTDPIADMLTRIRNAIAIGQSEVSLPHSKLKEQVAKILADSGFLTSIKTTRANSRKEMQIVINDKDNPPVITQINRLSRPGRRQYVSVGKIPKVKSGRGIVVLSTSKGIMSGPQAKQKGIGGELICEVY
ncbi:MAG: 30S ribosomal protein S8 [Candidatus Saccharibacteria bacterium GW2011_GWA2_46_10]|nr:MAG: 30S ribosomal protein S8 [Candidatus Saccharibacteria bacterium GW2011_GWA2_46_10]OGL35538.1 MAG: 30S ribosomal protein S8 [Candidatus Saccharibacteria bacterium RIFCSPHIGHO2_12_FULL_47_17]